MVIDEMWASIPTDTFFVIEKCKETDVQNPMVKPAVTEVSRYRFSPSLTTDTDFCSSLNNYILTPSALVIFMTFWS